MCEAISYCQFGMLNKYYTSPELRERKKKQSKDNTLNKERRRGRAYVSWINERIAGRMDISVRRTAVGKLKSRSLHSLEGNAFAEKTVTHPNFSIFSFCHRHHQTKDMRSAISAGIRNFTSTELRTRRMTIWGRQDLF